MFKKDKILLLSLLIFLTGCPKEPIWYNAYSGDTDPPFRDTDPPC